MWVGWFIDFIITAVTTGVILGSHGKYGYRLAGGSHTVTTVLMIIFWIICVIHFFICVANSSGAEEKYKAKQMSNAHDKCNFCPDKMVTVMNRPDGTEIFLCALHHTQYLKGKHSG